ncbi:MAG: FAD-dependent oxidoreductase, partial [Planctomycetota bacterium]
MNSLTDAIVLRDRMVQLLEQASLTEDLTKRCELLHLTVVGGGFTGIEVAGEFDQYLKSAARSYPNLDPANIKVTVLNRGDQILKSMSPELGEWTIRHFKERGIDVKLNTSAKTILENAVELTDGTCLPARTVVWCAGIAPNPSVKYFDVPTNDRGYIQCRRDLTVEGYDNVWGLGDAAVNPQAEGRPAYPATAQAAVGQAKVGAQNIIRTLRGEATKPCDLQNKGTLAAFGHGDAVAETFGIKLTGWIAWFMWRGVYLAKMPGFGRKVRIAADWTLSLFTRRDFVELGVERLVESQNSELNRSPER